MSDFLEERCAPRKVGFASAVENMVAQSRAREVEKLYRQQDAVANPGLEESHEKLILWLQDLGVSSEDAEKTLKRHETVVKLQLLHDMAAKFRALWAPGYCPWVGALDDEAKLIAKELADD